MIRILRPTAVEPSILKTAGFSSMNGSRNRAMPKKISSSFPSSRHRRWAMNRIVASNRIALRALKVNRMRSALTMLGIIIGVAAVIAMVGVGTGATERIQEQIQSIGSNLIIVQPGSLSSSGVRLGSGGVVSLTQDDAK